MKLNGECFKILHALGWERIDEFPASASLLCCCVNMAVPKAIRYLAGATVCIFVYLFLQILHAPQTDIHLPTPKFPLPKHAGSDRDPQLDRTTALSPTRTACLLTSGVASGEPSEPLRRVDGSNYAPNNPTSARINATILSLVRNEELEDMLQSMRDLERTWNHKFNYPWTFFNDKPFTAEFKKKTRAATNAEVRYGMSCSAYILDQN